MPCEYGVARGTLRLRLDRDASLAEHATAEVARVAAGPGWPEPARVRVLLEVHGASASIEIELIGLALAGD